MAVTLALSINDFVDKVGAYVGFAAAIGLALFALLLFAQARELKRLREWGAQAHDRMGELEKRLAAALELARRAGVQQRAGQTAPPRPQPQPRAAVPAPRPAGATPVLASTRAPVRLPLLPAAGAGVAGPALGSATAGVELPSHPPGTAPASADPRAVPAAQPALPVAASGPAGSATPAPATAAALGAAPAPASPPVDATPADPPTVTNGHSDTFPPVPPVRRATPPPAVRRPPSRPVRPAGARPAPAAPLRSRTPSASPRGGAVRADAPHGRRRLPLVLGGLAALAVAVVAALALTSGGDDAAGTAAPSQSTTVGQAGGATATPAPPHDRTTVAVLNGTTQQGLADSIARQLEADGFVRGPVTNASDQARTVTLVSYFGGHEREAQEVADTLDVPSDAVQPIDADTELSACQGSTACPATVVVTVGADRQ